MDTRHTTTSDDPPRGDGPDPARWVAAVVLGGAGCWWLVLGGLSAPLPAWLAGLVGYVLALGEMVRRLRADDPYALAVPVVAAVVWAVVLFLGMSVLGWSP